MLDKILNIFFEKKHKKKNITIISNVQRQSKIASEEKIVKLENNEKTCLSHYFSSHRGLNLVERGHTYKAI